MNLLCPNCQKPLTVPEQYAGQPMRCPLCAGTFTVPALPQVPAPPPAPPDVYGMQGAAAPPPATAAPPPDLGLPAPPGGPSPVTGTPPPPRPPAGPPGAYADEQPTFPVTPTPEGYQRKYTVWFSPKVLQYVAPAAVFLVFVLTFFPWTGVYPGGVADAWQHAWQATLGWYSTDPDVVEHHPPFPTDDSKPGLNILLIFYLMLLIPTLLVTLGCMALAFVPPSGLPPVVHQILPWRWGIVAALNLILLLFLILQLVLGFSLENRVIAATDNRVAEAAKARGTTNTQEARDDAIVRGMVRQAVSRTIWLDLVVFFHILAVLAAGMMFWLNRRGGRPAPRIDLLW